MLATIWYDFLHFCLSGVAMPKWGDVLRGRSGTTDPAGHSKCCSPKNVNIPTLRLWVKIQKTRYSGFHTTIAGSIGYECICII